MVTQYEFATLPLSGVLEVAMLDLKKVLRGKKYLVDFDNWHQPDPELGVCRVCLAGAVIAKTFKAQAKQAVQLNDFSDGERTRLAALDEVRRGEIKYAISMVNVNAGWSRISHAIQDLPPSTFIRFDPYRMGYPTFFRRLKLIVKVLRLHGF